MTPTAQAYRETKRMLAGLSSVAPPYEALIEWIKQDGGHGIINVVYESQGPGAILRIAPGMGGKYGVEGDRVSPRSRPIRAPHPPREEEEAGSCGCSFAL